MSQGPHHPDGPEPPEPRENDRQPFDIADAYRKAYADGKGLAEELEDWAHEGCGDGLEP